jgi:hypothetical protein
MKIDTYPNLKIKAKYFESKIIDSKEEFDELAYYWTDAKAQPSRDSDRKVIFRGLTEAKYKLFNSAQRFWIGEELDKLGRTYEEFIETEIESAKTIQSNLLLKYYHAFGHPAYDLSILSFLQHYGAPTPLLDFTYKFDCAAFFATDGLQHNPSTDIENYFSIYAIDTSKTRGEFPSIIDQISISLSQIDEILINNSDNEIDPSKVLQKYEQLQYKTFHDLTLFHIPGFTPNGFTFKLKSRPQFNLIFNQHNLNIINQEGLFVFNSDPTIPLEYHFSGKSEVDSTFHLPKIKCWNIHKSLKEYVIRYLNEGTNTPRTVPIDRRLMFPQEEFIAKSSFEQFKKFK